MSSPGIEHRLGLGGVLERVRRAAPTDPEDRSYVAALLLATLTALHTDWSVDASLAIWLFLLLLER